MYKFPLESLRKYRKRKEELHQKYLYECDQELNQEVKKLNALNYKKTDITKKSRSFKANPFKPSDKLLFEQYFNNLNQKILEQNSRIREKKEKKLSVTNKLLNAVKNRKMIEKLKEYRYSEYKNIETKKLQFESDESAVLRFKKGENEH